MQRGDTPFLTILSALLRHSAPLLQLLRCSAVAPILLLVSARDSRIAFSGGDAAFLFLLSIQIWAGAGSFCVSAAIQARPTLSSFSRRCGRRRAADCMASGEPH